MVADMGCDPTGVESCDDALEEVVGNNVLVEFPSGRYRFEEQHRFDEVDNLGIVGTGEHHEAVEFVFPSGYSGIFLGLWGGSNWRIENFTVQQSLDKQTGVGIELVTFGGLEIRDIEIAGYSPYNRDGGQRGLYCDILQPDGVGVIERYRYRGPSHVGNYPQGTQAFLADEYHRGTLYCRDWWLENCGENGLYGSQTPGDVRVEGGLFRNNDVASIRVCGDGSYVKDATIVIDTDNDHPANDGTFDNPRGIWWESGTFSKSGGFVENCTFLMKSAAESQGLLRIERTAGGIEIRDCRFENETQWATIDVIEPISSFPAASTRFRAKNIQIAALGRGRAPVQITGRPRSELRQITVRCTHPDRDGVDISNSPGCLLARSTVIVERYPIRIRTGDERGRCLLRVSGQINLTSTTVVGHELIQLAEFPAGSSMPQPICIQNNFGTETREIVMIDSGADGVFGRLIGENGGFIDPNVPRADGRQSAKTGHEIPLRRIERGEKG